MTTRAWFVLAAAGAAFMWSVTAGARTHQAQTEAELARTGEALVDKVCSTSCHGLEKVDDIRRSSRDWNTQVVDMAGRGAMATQAQFAAITRYLTRYYGIVAVNTAPAEEFSAVLGLSPREAQAVVAYRTANGTFKTIEDLLKVPGIDKARIEEQPDALRF